MVKLQDECYNVAVIPTGYMVASLTMTCLPERGWTKNHIGLKRVAFFFLSSDARWLGPSFLEENNLPVVDSAIPGAKKIRR